MHNTESDLENEIHKLQWDCEIEMDHLISAWRWELVMIREKKRGCLIVDIAVAAEHRVNLKENEKKDKYLELAWELKKKCGTWKWQWYQL